MTSSTPTSTGNRFDPLEFYELSKEIAKVPTEVCLRTAIGRAYYSMFLYAQSRPSVSALLNRNSLNSAGSHDHVIMMVARVQAGKPIANKLRKLKKLRKLADYEMACATPPRDWENNWAVAKVLVEDLVPHLKSL